MARGRTYAPDEVEVALQTAAVYGIRPAARMVDVPVATLSRWTWKPPHSFRWAEINRGVPLERSEWAAKQDERIARAGHEAA